MSRGLVLVHQMCSFLAAGLGAGMAEAILAVTPSETIKFVFRSLRAWYSPEYSFRVFTLGQFRTKIIDDANSANPRFKGLVHGTRTIVREEGLRGIYRGLFPVVSIRLVRVMYK